MRFLTTFAWLRPPTDHGVDRPELEAQQCVQVTGTNRPRAYTQTAPKESQRVHCAVSETTHPRKNTWALFHRVTAAIAAGKRPVPFRTRKLSLPAPMVLHS